MNTTSHDPARGALPFSAGAVAHGIEDAILSRRSLRAFKPDPVPRETVERILAVAGRALIRRTVSPRSACEITSSRPLEEYPMVIDLISELEWSGSSKVADSGS